MPIRKEVHALCIDDFERSPVWEFALDEVGHGDQSEATVRPYKPNGPLDPGTGMFVVRASFRLADGTLALGYLSPPIASYCGIEIVQPTVLLPDGQLRLWCGLIAPDPDALDRLYERLERSPAELFPLSYESAVPLVSGPVRGEVRGFAHYRSRQDMTIVEAV
jgi:hypothetical protein